MFGFLKRLFSGNRAAYEGGYPPIGGKFQFPFVDGKLLLYAIKAGSQPTKQDVEHMVSHSILNEIEQLKNLKYTCELSTLKQIRGFNEGIKWKAPPNQKDWILEATVAVLAMSQLVMKQHGALKAGDKAQGLTLWRSKDMNLRSSMCLLALVKTNE